VHRHGGVHIGIATQTPNGLIVPVVRHAEARDVWAARRSRAPRRPPRATARRRATSCPARPSPSPAWARWAASPTTPVINRPEVAIIGVNKIIERPVVRDGQIVVRKMMNLSSSFDHRVVDGWDAAEFIQKIKALLEQPATLFMDDERWLKITTKVLVIGGGPGGYVAAIRAGQLGLDTVLVEATARRHLPDASAASRPRR
jgi:2-oxoisovalerate dehydrogenase E2 component (dihydrolipoyl transacylase)